MLQIGPGVVHIRVQACGFEFLIIQTVTPLKPLQQRLHQDFYVPHWWLLPLAKPFILMELIQVYNVFCKAYSINKILFQIFY